MHRNILTLPTEKWRVGDRINFRLWDANKIPYFSSGKITSRVPAQKIFNVMDDRGRMWRVSYDG